MVKGFSFCFQTIDNAIISLNVPYRLNNSMPTGPINPITRNILYIRYASLCFHSETVINAPTWRES